MADKFNIFRGGVPTEPEVNRLKKAYPNPSGLIPYEDIEKVIICKRTGPTRNRFNSILSAWRNYLVRELKLYTKGVANKGFLIIPQEEMAEHSHSKLDTGVKYAVKASQIAADIDVDKLNPLQRQEAQVTQRLTSVVADYMVRQKRELTFTVKTSKTLPNPGIPE